MGRQRQKERWEGGSHQPRNAWSPRKLEEARKDPQLEPSEELLPCEHLDSRLLDFRTVTSEISVISSHSVCGHLLQLPSDGNTGFNSGFNQG